MKANELRPFWRYLCWRRSSSQLVVWSATEEKSLCCPAISSAWTSSRSTSPHDSVDLCSPSDLSANHSKDFAPRTYDLKFQRLNLGEGLDICSQSWWTPERLVPGSYWSSPLLFRLVMDWIMHSSCLKKVSHQQRDYNWVGLYGWHSTVRRISTRPANLTNRVERETGSIGLIVSSAKTKITTGCGTDSLLYRQRRFE